MYIESSHANNTGLAKLVNEKKVFAKDYETQWICKKCGYHTIAKNSPLECPFCHHEYSYFELLCDKY